MRPLLKKAHPLSTTQLYSGKWLRFNTTDYMIDNLKISNYEYIERTTRKGNFDGVDIITFLKYPKTKQPTKLILIANYRPPIGKYVLEWPAGIVENSEQVYEEAMRELKEETGYNGKRLSLEGKKGFGEDSPVLYGDPWKSNECGKLVLAEVDGDDERNQGEGVKQSLEEGESIGVHLLEVREGMLGELEELAREREYEIAGKVYAVVLGMSLGRVGSVWSG